MASADRSIPAIVKAHASADPQAIFCAIAVGRTVDQLTFGELYRDACAYARELRTRGIGPGDVVAVILRHGRDLFTSYLGVMLAGAIPTYMPFPSPKQHADAYWADHDALFARLKPRLIVTYAENAEAARGRLAARPYDFLVAPLAGAPAGDPDEAFPGLRAALDDTACLQHSSGTTGLKKGVMLSHRAIVAQVDAYGRSLDFGPADRIVSWLPLYHDMGFIACFMTSLIAGTTLIALDPFEWVVRPVLLLEAIERFRPTLCWMPNFAFSHTVRTVKRDARHDLTSMRAFINCSEPCKAETFRRFTERFSADGIDATKLQICYAMAENVFAVTQTRLGESVPAISIDAEAFADHTVRAAEADRPSQTLVSCGEAVDGVRLRIVRADGGFGGDDQIGEIQVTGTYLFGGYYRQPEVTAERMREGWYATGDLGFTRAGQLYVTGRKDDMIIVNGRNFYAHEIELLVSDVPGVIPGRCTAIAVEDLANDATSVVVLAECRQPADVSSISRSIREGMQDRFGLLPSAVTLVPPGSLVKTTSGKISRGKNKELYVTGALAQAAAIS